VNSSPGAAARGIANLLVEIVYHALATA